MCVYICYVVFFVCVCICTTVCNSMQIERDQSHIPSQFESEKELAELVRQLAQPDSVDVTDNSVLMAIDAVAADAAAGQAEPDPAAHSDSSSSSHSSRQRESRR
jgi:hypothetical protein